MKTSSAKSKGRRLQQYIRDSFRQIFKEKLEPEDIESRQMGGAGVDIILSPAAKKLIPFDLEAKNQEKISIWQCLNQAEANQTKPDRIPALVFSRNHSKTYIVIEFESFLNLVYPGTTRDQLNEISGADEAAPAAKYRSLSNFFLNFLNDRTIFIHTTKKVSVKEKSVMGRAKKYHTEEERRVANNEKVKRFYWANKEECDRKARERYWRKKLANRYNDELIQKDDELPVEQVIDIPNE